MIPTRLLHGGRSEHLSRSVLLEETGVPLILRAVVGFGAVVLLAFLVWALTATVDEVAFTSGQIVPEGKVHRVQHWQGGIVDEILVANGDTVRAGQVLIRLDPFIVESQWAQSRVRMESLLAHRERLEALIDGRPPEFAGLGLSDTSLTRRNADIHRQILRSRETSRRILQEQISQARAEKAALIARQETFGLKKGSMQEEIGQRAEWKGVIPYTRVDELGLERVLSEFESGLRETVANSRRTDHLISELTNRLTEMDQRILETALLEHARVSEDFVEAQENFRENQRKHELLQIRAPVDGIVHALSANSVGGVIEAGDAVLEIVPEFRDLVAEVEVSERDIGHVRVGQPVLVKFTTYDFGRYGGLEGQLVRVSATSFPGGGGTRYYKGTVQLMREDIDEGSALSRVLPGMTVQADIKTGSKTIMQYLLKPIYASALQAFRER